MKNARLKQELDRVAGLTAKYLGRPFTHMPQGTPQMSPLAEFVHGRVPIRPSPAVVAAVTVARPRPLSRAWACRRRTCRAMHPPALRIDAGAPIDGWMAARAMDNSIYSKLSNNFHGDIRYEGSQDTAWCMSPAASSKCSWTPSTPKHHVPRMITDILAHV
ncbi:hypothetical protein ZWY2020_015984 [Hordeum vulgare]|nr:hypothetical protein ZWY2020_015984 [Hordeum vulgare]